MAPAGRRTAGRRAGFSMLEAVIALAVLSFTATLVTARASVVLDQMATHAAFQRFQTGLLALRARAYGEATDLPATPLSLPPPAGWSYRSASPLIALADGRCLGAEVELVRAGRLRARLQPRGDGCRYLRAR